MRILCALLMVSAGCSTAAPARLGTPVAAAAGPTVDLHVNGMACPLCATNVKKSLERVEGVRSAQVDLSAGVVRVELADAGTDREAALRAAVVDAGFAADRVERKP